MQPLIFAPTSHRLHSIVAVGCFRGISYVPWFPYPKVGVAELEPPNVATNSTSWDFRDILPQLELVMNATLLQGHTVVPNFSTQPTWMVRNALLCLLMHWDPEKMLFFNDFACLFFPRFADQTHVPAV